MTPTLLASGLLALLLGAAPAKTADPPAKAPAVEFQVADGQVAFQVELAGRRCHGTASKAVVKDGGNRLVLRGMEKAPAVLWLEPAMPTQGRQRIDGGSISINLIDGSFIVKTDP